MYKGDDDSSGASPRAVRNLIFSRIFNKHDAKQQLDWWIETHPTPIPEGTGYVWVPVYGDKRGTRALKAIEADGVPVGLIERINRFIVGKALKNYELMFWNEAWQVAKQYGLPRNVIGTMSRDAFAKFVCHDLFSAGFVKAMEMAPGYDPTSGFTVGSFVRARVRQGMHAHMRETVNDVRVPRGQQFTKEISRDVPSMGELGTDRDLGEHTEWEKFISLLDVDWCLHITKAVHAAVQRGDMPERWGRILELRFLCEPEQRLTLERIGKLLGIGKSRVHEEQQRAIQAIGPLLDPAIRRLRDIQQIFWEAQNKWKLSATRKRRGRPELFEERPDQITLRERTVTAPQNVAALPGELERPNPDDESYRQFKARTGDPDWQPKAKAKHERQRIGLLFPCSKGRLVETADQTIAAGYPVRCWHMRRWEWRAWGHDGRNPVVLVKRVSVYRVMRGSENNLAA